MSILSILLFVNIFLLNTSNKLIICSALFVGSALAVNSMVEFYGKNQAMRNLIICTTLACILKWQNFSVNPYYSLSMILISYTAVLISIVSNIVVFEKLRSKFNFHMANYATLIAASIIDSTIVCVGLLHKFSASKCLSIYIRDIIFKFSYSSVLGVFLFVAVYTFNVLRNRWVTADGEKKEIQ